MMFLLLIKLLKSAVKTLLIVLVLSAPVLAKPHKKSAPQLQDGILATNYIVKDLDTGEVFKEKNSQEVRSIASITKLFTAIVLLRSGAELDEKVKVDGSSSGRFPNGTMVSRMNLLKAMLITSDNRAAETLAKTYPGGFAQFILDVDQYIQGRGLMNTRINDSTGLLVTNVSTAEDLVRFLGSISANEVIRSIAGERNTTVSIPKGKKTIKINLHNTNPSVFTFDNILISKTGFTNPAGWCIDMLIRHQGQEFDLIVLGSPSKKVRNDLVAVKLKSYMNLITRSAVIEKIDNLEYDLLTNP